MIRIELGKDSYNIELQRGILRQAGVFLNLNRKVMIVTDEGVPSDYATCVAKQSKEAYIKTIPQGETSKSLKTVEMILAEMLKYGFSRKDCVIAVGGGVVGDISGFVAALYMRGIDFYNIPTTVLAQVDSSIGGKTAVNLAGIKNIIGAFYQPKAVLIDPNTLETLSERLVVNGLIEALKMGMTHDRSLYEIFQKQDWKSYLDIIIEKALLVKKIVVEQDEKETHIRKVLNFGHTIGHGFESASQGKLLHGECVAMGMLYMCSEKLRQELVEIYENLGMTIPDLSQFDIQQVKKAILHDKKATDERCSVIYVSNIEEVSIEDWPMEVVLDRLGRG